jgi:hypothetical protein
MSYIVTTITKHSDYSTINGPEISISFKGQAYVSKVPGKNNVQITTIQGVSMVFSIAEIVSIDGVAPLPNTDDLIEQIILAMPDVGGGGSTDLTDIENRLDDIETALPLKADLVGGFVPLAQLPVQTLTTYVSTYADLPAANTVTGQKYGVVTSTGTRYKLFEYFAGTYYPKGYYYSNGTIWIYMGDFPYQASQADVDAGIITDQFVSPNTFANSAKVSEVTANTAARHTHNNFTLLQTITEAFTTALKTAYDSAVTWITTNGTNILNHLASTSNPHSVTSSQVGLGNLTNVAQRTYTRTTNGDSNYTIPDSTRVAATSASFTAARTWTLPLAANVPAGEIIEVSDAFGGVTSANTLIIQRAGSSDTINGATTETIGSAYGARRFISNGSNAWAFDKGILRASNNLSDLASAATARTNLGAQAAITTSRAAPSGDVSMATAGTWYTGASISLAAGTYIVEAHISFSGSVAAAHVYGARIYNGSSTLVAGNVSVPNSTNRATTIKIGDIITLGSTTTLYLDGAANQNSATITQNTNYLTQAGATVIYAVKIA